MNDFSNTEFGYDPSLALFNKPSVNSGVSSHKWVQHRPISQISNTGLLEFSISGTSTSYINLKCSLLQIQGKIVENNGKNLEDSDEVSLINLPLQSLWSQVDISLQQKVTSSRVGTNYAYKSYLDTLLNTNVLQQKAQLTSQMFHKDPAGEMDTNGLGNTGFYVRGKRTKKSKIIQIIGPLCLDLCEQERLILNGIEINLKFWPNKPAFLLQSADKESRYEFVITDAYLNVCMVDVSPAILVGHASTMKDYPALYPFLQSDIKSFSIAQGLFDYTVDNIFQGDIPSEVLIGLVASEAYNGSYKRNPFDFQHYNCNFCGFYINGESAPTEPFQPNFPEKKKESDTEHTEENTPTQIDSYNEPYLSLFGPNYFSADVIPISWYDYPFGYCLYKFRLNETGNSFHDKENVIPLPRRGHTRLILRFKKALKESVNVIIYARFPRLLQIDQARNVIL